MVYVMNEKLAGTVQLGPAPGSLGDVKLNWACLRCALSEGLHGDAVPGHKGLLSQGVWLDRVILRGSRGWLVGWLAGRPGGRGLNLRGPVLRRAPGADIQETYCK